jgi:hypothetical protein
MDEKALMLSLINALERIAEQLEIHNEMSLREASQVKSQES